MSHYYKAEDKTLAEFLEGVVMELRSRESLNIGTIGHDEKGRTWEIVLTVSVQSAKCLDNETKH